MPYNIKNVRIFLMKIVANKTGNINRKEVLKTKSNNRHVFIPLRKYDKLENQSENKNATEWSLWEE